jgi:DNA-binding protein Fis
MSVTTSVFTILLQTADAEVLTQFKQVFKDMKDASVVTVRDAAAFQKESARHQFDAVVIESRGGEDAAGGLPAHIDLAQTLVITGSRTVLKRAAKMLLLLHQQTSQILPGKNREVSLEGYLEMKMGDFVKGMRSGSARNLHPILISAVERPLIVSALRETQGNQIQAAALLGLNRNTLRKKITELHIPLKRTRTKLGQTA